MGLAISLLFARKKPTSAVSIPALVPDVNSPKDAFLAHKSKREQKSVQENTLLNLTAERIAERLAAFPRAEVRELPDDLLQVVLDKAIELGTLRADTLGCFSGAEGLYRLQLRDYPHVDDLWVTLFAKSCELMVVDLARCRLLSDRSLAALASRPTIRELHLGDSPAITDEGIRALSHGLHASLRTLELSNLPALTTSSLVHLGALLQLTALSLSKCPGLEGEGLEYLTRLSKLETLTLAYNVHASDDFLLHTTPSPLPSLPPAFTVTNPSSAHYVTAAPKLALPLLVTLDLRSIRISDPTLPWLRGRSNLAVLRLVNCRLTDVCLDAIGSLPSLKELDLSNNLISSNGLHLIAPLTNLNVLQLNHCGSVSGQGLKVLRNMPALQQLCLDSCPLSDPALSFLSQVQSLHHLDLSDTNISDALLESLASLTNLRVLELGQTELTDRGMRHLRPLTNLITLNLDCRNVDDESLKQLVGMTRLEVLDLYSARIGDEGLSIICSSFPLLRKLEVCGGFLTNAGCEDLPKLRNLRDLNLSHNRIGDRALIFIAQCVRLSWLNLSHTKVSNTGLLLLNTLTRLRDLRLSSTRVTETGVQSLQELLPQLVSVGYD